MIHGSDLSEETQKFANMLEEAGDRAKAEIAEDLHKISENIYDKTYEILDTWFSSNIKENFLQTVAYDVDRIITDFLSGKLETIKNTYITSDYTFDNLHQIRLAIWRAAGQDIEGHIIKEQEEQIEKLKKDVERLERYR